MRSALSSDAIELEILNYTLPVAGFVGTMWNLYESLMVFGGVATGYGKSTLLSIRIMNVKDFDCVRIFVSLLS